MSQVKELSSKIRAFSLEPGETNLPATVSTRKKKSKRRKLFDLHAWLGFHLAFFMTLVIVTGTFAVVADEIDWLIHPQMRVTPTEQAADWGKIEDAITAYAPGDALLQLGRHEGDHFAYRATMKRAGGLPYYLYIDPATAEVKGTTSGLTVQRFLRDLHRYLFMPSIIGLPLVSALSFILAFSMYTGIKTTRKWKTVATRVRTDKGARIAVGDFHKAAGLWSLWFFVVVIVTSLWYLAEFGFAVGKVRFEPPRPKIAVKQIVEYGPVLEDAGAAAYIQTAKAAYPGWTPNLILYPVRPNTAVMITGEYKDILVRDRANSAFLDPVTADVLNVRKSSELGAVAYLNEVADPIHFGFFGGLTTKIIWFIFGLAMSALSFTGVWLTWKRMGQAKVSRAQIATLPILLATMFTGNHYVQGYVVDARPEFEIAGNILEPQTDSFNSITQQLSFTTEKNGDLTGQFRLTLLSPKGRPNLKSVQYTLGDGKPIAAKPELFGRQSIFTGSVDPDLLEKNGLLGVVLTFNNDETEITNWHTPQ